MDRRIVQSGDANMISLISSVSMHMHMRVFWVVYACMCTCDLTPIRYVRICEYGYTGWRRCIGCLKLQMSFRKRATNYRALSRESKYKDKASYASSLPCMSNVNPVSTKSPIKRNRTKNFFVPKIYFIRSEIFFLKLRSEIICTTNSSILNF